MEEGASVRPECPGERPTLLCERIPAFVGQYKMGLIRNVDLRMRAERLMM
jgi:hypothetical protein